MACFNSKEEVINAALQMYDEGRADLKKYVQKVLSSGLVSEEDYDYLLVRAILLEFAQGYVNFNATGQRKIHNIVKLV